MEFFINRLGADVLRIAPDGRKSVITVKNYETAQYLFDLTEYGYKFEIPFRVHSNPQPSACISCEG